jgi:hypothetical protein
MSWGKGTVIVQRKANNRRFEAAFLRSFKR